MNYQLENLIEQMEQYITKSVFNDFGEVFRKNIQVMKYNTQHEWFNCCLIAMASQSSFVIVNTEKGWKNYYEVETLEKSGLHKPVTLMKPTIIEEDDGQFVTFTPFQVYFQDAYTKPRNFNEFHMVSSLQTVISKYKFIEMKSHLKKGWNVNLVHNYLSSFDFYYEANATLRRFYYFILIYAFGDLLDLKYEFNKQKLDCDDFNIELMALYKHTHALVTGFHLHFRFYLKKMQETVQLVREKDLYRTQEFPHGYEILQALEDGNFDEVRSQIELER